MTNDAILDAGMKLSPAVKATLLALVLEACAHETMISKARAIDLAASVCRKSLGKSFPIPRPEDKWPAKEWEARREGDHWFVWVGVSSSPVYSVRVPNKGRPLGSKTKCFILIED
jgi:hypothetical protein